MWAFVLSPCMVVVCFLTTLWPFILARLLDRLFSLNVLVVCPRSTCGSVFSLPVRLLVLAPRRAICFSSMRDRLFSLQTWAFVFAPSVSICSRSKCNRLSSLHVLLCVFSPCMAVSSGSTQSHLFLVHA